MLRLILPVILALIGAGAGIGAGLMLKPADVKTEASIDCPVPEKPMEKVEDAPDPNTEFVKLNNQFVIPVLKDGRVISLVLLSLSLETTLGLKETVYAREPKLRDSFLRVLFDHANSGGFAGNFTSSSHMSALERALLEAAQSAMGYDVVDVLVTDIARQDS